MKPLALATLALALLSAACASGVKTAGRTNELPQAQQQEELSLSEAVVVSSAAFTLGRSPGQGEINRFYRTLDNSQNKVIEDAGGPHNLPEGFSYSVTPDGAVNPFSTVVVSCLLSRAAAAGPGAQYCRQFIDQLLPQYNSPDYKQP